MQEVFCNGREKEGSEFSGRKGGRRHLQAAHASQRGSRREVVLVV